MTNVIVSADARHDRDDILDYLEREAGSEIAEKYALLFRDCILKLMSQPKRGSRRLVLGPAVRAVVVTPYLMIYDYDSGRDEVVVLRILHVRRNITRRLLRPRQPK